MRPRWGAAAGCCMKEPHSCSLCIRLDTGRVGCRRGSIINLEREASEEAAPQGLAIPARDTEGKRVESS